MGSLIRTIGIAWVALGVASCAVPTESPEEIPEVPVEPEAPILIDPSIDCTPYPSARILSEISIEYVEGTVPDPREIEQIERILVLFSYAVTQGLERIVIEENQACSFCTGAAGVYAAADLSANEIFLCRTREPNGETGAVFAGFQEGDYTELEFILGHEIGHWFDHKANGISDRYAAFLISEYPELEEIGVNNREIFASDFSRYFWFRDSIELQTSDDQVRWSDGRSGLWLQENVFCGNRYDIQSASWQLNYALYFLEDCRDPAQALDELWVMFDRFPGSAFLPQAIYGAGRTYEQCYDDMQTAFLIYRDALLEYPDQITDFNTRMMLRKVDSYYHQQAALNGAAIGFYLELIGIYSASSVLDQILYNLGRWYYETDDCSNATAILGRLTEEYSESYYANLIPTQTMLAECQE